ncbi:MAG: T9SS type A sorting domain-containing protein, partial [Bacteroidetes bacterium]
QNDTITNPGFERWGTNPFYDEPEGWTTLNPLASILGAELAFKAEGAGEFHSGTAAIKLVTTTVTGIGVTPSILSNGNINAQTQSVEGGSPVNSRPLSFGGWFRFDPSGADTAFVTITFTKWNAGAGVTDVIGAADTLIVNSSGAFVNYDMAIEYSSQEVPDTVLIIIGSGSDSSPQEGSALYVDDLYYSYPQGIQVAEESGIHVFPNPASDHIRIDAAAPALTQARIFSMDGRVVLATPLSNGVSTISVADLPSGAYILEMQAEEGQRFVHRLIRE